MLDAWREAASALTKGASSAKSRQGNAIMEADFMLLPGEIPPLSPARPAAPVPHTGEERFQDWGNSNPLWSADFFHLEE
jgi:hypothetical protein